MTYTGAVQNYPTTESSVPALPRCSALLWLVGRGAFVLIEPSPYEFAFLSALIVFFSTGVKMRPLFLPLVFLLLLINIGYTTSAAAMLDQTQIVNWLVTSWYLAVTAMFFAMVMSEEHRTRLHS